MKRMTKPTGIPYTPYPQGLISIDEAPDVPVVRKHTDTDGSPSETLHPELETFMTNLRKVRDEVEAGRLRR